MNHTNGKGDNMPDMLNRERDLFINWLYNNDERELADDTMVFALELYDEGHKTMEQLKTMIRGF